jgi:flagellar protein FlaG
MELFSNVASTHKDNYTNNIQKENQHLIKKSEEINKIENHNEKIKDNNNDIQHKKEKITKEKLQELTQKLNKEMEPLNPDIKFNFNEKIDNFVVNVVDKNTNKIIRKIPSDEALKIMEKMRELVGALFDKKG